MLHTILLLAYTLNVECKILPAINQLGLLATPVGGLGSPLRGLWPPGGDVLRRAVIRAGRWDGAPAPGGVLADDDIALTLVLPANSSANDLGDHSMVTTSGIFPYVVAILKRSSYVSTGALIDNQWVLTGADALYLIRESIRHIRVRLGTINYKKGGIILPIKVIHIHPYFQDTKPEFDLALIMLSEPVKFSPAVNSIRLLQKPRPIAATHFLVTSWPPADQDSEEPKRQQSMEMIQRRRILTVTHLHPSDPEYCLDELQSVGINNSRNIMCLDATPKGEACERDTGAPMVLNGILWGIISSWRPDNCAEELSGPSFVSLLSAPDISSWIHSTLQGHKWTNEENEHEFLKSKQLK